MSSVIAIIVVAEICVVGGELIGIAEIANLG
jgi:hypothetical protein